VGHGRAAADDRVCLADPAFQRQVDIGFDAVQDSGQKIEFGETRKVVLRRPDRLRIDATKRERHYRREPMACEIEVF
jgi:hypothetical protein